MVSNLIVLLNAIVNQYFSNTRCLICVTDGNLLYDTKRTPILNLNSMDGNLNISDVLFRSFGCHDFIVQVRNPASTFEVLEKEILYNKERYNRRKYVFLQSSTETEVLLEIFNTSQINFVSDVIAITIDTRQSDNEIFTVWTHPYKGGRERNVPHIIEKWFSKNNSFMLGINLFPDKLRNQAGKTLRVATFQYEPYTIVEQLSSHEYKYMGSEMMTMHSFAMFYNMTVVPVVSNVEQWGEIYSNWTGNGVMGNLVEDRADIGAAALYTWENIYYYLDLSKPTVRTGITCLVPAPKPSNRWLTPLKAFAGATWFAVILVYVTGTITGYLSELVTSLTSRSLKGFATVFTTQKVITTVIKPFINQNVTRTEMLVGTLGKYVMGMVFVATTILVASYSSGLATIMTVPRYDNPVDTVEDFVRSGWKWGATQNAWITSIEKAQEKNYRKLVQRFRALSEEELRTLSLTGEFAFSLERLPHDNFAVGSYIKRDVIQNFHLMRQDFYWEQCVIMARKSSILLPLLDDFVLRVFEAGLISFWQNEAATSYMDHYIQKAVKYFLHHGSERGVVKLKMIHVQGAFGVLFVGNAMACVAFLVEIVAHRWRTKTVIK